MPNDPKSIKRVMISSTARDLPEHRKEVMDACLRQGMFPVMMEHLPANDEKAISASLKMVDEADIYVGVFAYRYGYIPKENNPKQISVTEMEYKHAVERKIPRLIFVIDKSHPITADEMDIENAGKLKTFKDHIQTNNIVNFFKSPADLRAHVINSISQYRETDITQFHYVSDIPQPPEAYIAHPYTLLQTHRLVGRQNELNLLTNWVTRKQEEIYWTRILNIVAIGGMGKSAMTWKWFNDIAPQEMKPLAGRMWWSFYESDASFENFIIRALAYVSKRSIEEVRNTPLLECETNLLAILNRDPYLIVLDGLERILTAYARMDAARLSDDDFDKQTANFVTKAYGLPESAAQSFVGQHFLRKTADPRAGMFLRKLSNIQASRILISTRLYPNDLQSIIGEPIKGCFAFFLQGLDNDDALNLWRAFNVSGSYEALIPMFNKFENHPLLMQSLASEIANYRRAPGNFEQWKMDHPNFNPFKLSLVNARAHVLEYALLGLADNACRVLETIAGFRMPAHYDTLAAIFVGENKLFLAELDLDRALKELEDRGLVGWDKRANRYDLHPIVRGVVWSRLPDETRNGVFSSLQAHFDSIPELDSNKINSLDALTPAIELFSTLIGLARYDDALKVFQNRIQEVAFYRLSANRQQAELLEMLFPENTNQMPQLNNSRSKSFTLNSLALAYNLSGRPGLSVPLYQNSVTIDEKSDDLINVCVTRGNLSATLRNTGALHESESAALYALKTARKEQNHHQEAVSLCMLALTLLTRNILQESDIALRRALQMNVSLTAFRYEGVTIADLSEHAFRLGKFDDALLLAEQASRLAESIRYERDSIRAERLQGTAILGLGNLMKADECLNHALTRARAVNLVQEELPSITALAELRRRQGDLKTAHELLNDVWELAERGPFPLYHADAFNVLAQIERDRNNKKSAIEAAVKAYRLAWCDGPPYAYFWGLKKATQHMKDLGIHEPDMPLYSQKKYGALPKVEINPKGMFWIDPNSKFNIDDHLEKK